MCTRFRGAGEVSPPRPLADEVLELSQFHNCRFLDPSSTICWTYGSMGRKLDLRKTPSHREKRRVDPGTKPTSPKDLTRLFVERANARDAAGIAALLRNEDAVMAFPPGGITVGPRTLSRRCGRRSCSAGPTSNRSRRCRRLNQRRHRPWTSTPPRDAAGGSTAHSIAVDRPMAPWLRLLDQPEFVVSLSQGHPR